MFWAFLLLLLGIFVFYIPALWYDYIIDDFAIYASSGIKPKSKWQFLWRQFKGDKFWGRPNPYAHSIPIIVHFVACLMIYFAFGRTPIACLAALLFAAHPVNSEIVAGLTGKPYAITAVLIMLAWAVPFLAPFIYSLTVLPYPSAIINAQRWYFTISMMVSPLIYIALASHWSWLALIVFLTFWVKIRYMVSPKLNLKIVHYTENTEALSINIRKFIVAIKFYGYYFVNGVLGLHFSFYQGYMSEHITHKRGVKDSAKLDRYFFIGLIVLYILITNLIWNYSWRVDMLTENPALFGLLWFTINIAMFCNFFSVGQMHLTCRYFYLPGIGLMIFLAAIAREYPFVAIFLLGWYLRQLIYARRQYENNWWHNFYQLADEPRYYYSWLLFGNLMYARGHFGAALQNYLEALNYEKNNFKVYFNITSCYIFLNEFDKAIVYLEESKKYELMGQEKTRLEWIEEREILLGKLLQAKERKIKVSMNLEEVAIVI
jgi:hypothetical protein